MIQIAIEEPSIERFFNYSKDEMIKALKFLADNNIREFIADKENLSLTKKQEDELDERIKSFHSDRSMGISWDEIKKEYDR